MPNQKFLSHVLKSQLMETLKFQYSNVLVHQSQQPASHALPRHALIALNINHLHDQQQVVQSVHHLIVHVQSVQLQIVRVPSVQFLVVHVLMHLVAKNQPLKRLLLTSAKSQRLVQLSL
jgi:hypothetical protein